MADELPIVCGKPLNQLTDEDFRSVEWLRYLAAQDGLDTDAQIDIQGPCRWAADEIDRLRLTAAEREAIEEAIKAFDEFAGDEVYVVALRTLLERTLPPHPTQSDGSLPSECA